jgi:hypothetical protein
MACGIRARTEIRNEGTLDFHRLQREAPQVCERRVAGSEIVETEPDTHAGELLQRCLDAADRVDQQAFRDLELQALRCNSLGANDRLDSLDKPLLLELARRDVHRDMRQLDALAPPAAY